MGEIPKYTDSERLMASKTDYLLMKAKSLSAWISRFVGLKKKTKKNRVLCHLNYRDEYPAIKRAPYIRSKYLLPSFWYHSSNKAISLSDPENPF